ncbi:hypothetical protein FBU31_000258 [Coemansia sp. 'formosensis']|nr:hypothetical protein FBU31_000258 [Coemansia sp. 'formosensis']
MRETLSVCSVWRQAALDYMWRELNLNIYEEKNEVYDDRPPWVDGYWMPHRTACLVKELGIIVSWNSIFSGAAFDLLEEYMDATCLPQVYKLRILITDKAIKLDCVYDKSISNALKFVELLKRIAPAASSVVFRGSRGGWQIEEGGGKAFGAFIQKLFSNARHSALDLGGICIAHTSTLAQISQLTALIMQGLTMDDLRTSLLHRCSNTLIDLGICTNDPKLLISDKDGNAVVYPNLNILTLSSYTKVFTIDASSVIATPKSIVPFPRLNSLTLHMCYPYADDVLFKGNSSTLKRLRIYIDGDTVRRLNQCKGLENKHKSLRHVEIIDIVCTKLLQIPEDDINRFLGNLLDTAQVLKVDTQYVIRKLITAMRSGYNLNFIQNLYVQSPGLNIYSILNLVKGLPALTILECGFRGDGDTGYEFIPAYELPGHIATTYGNAGKNLHTWKLLSYASSLGQTAEHVALLGLVCPRLCRIMIGVGNSSHLNARVAETIKSDAYSKYAAQLAHLHGIAIAEYGDYTRKGTYRVAHDNHNKVYETDDSWD